MVQCCVYGCSNKSGEKSQLAARNFLRLYRFPKDLELQREWLLRTEREDQREVDPSGSFVCSDHFDDADFEESNFMRAKLYYYHRMQIPLKSSAIPKIAEGIIVGYPPELLGRVLVC